jgi:hypothetical protein
MPIVTCAAAAVVREVDVRAAGSVPERAVAAAAVCAVAAAAPPAARAGPPAISAAKAQASTQRRASPGHAGLAGPWSRCVRH